MSEMKRGWPVWSEGYAMNSDFGPAVCHGKFEADTFDDAVRQAFPDDSLLRKTNGNWYYWGCRLHDNEADARRNFG